MVKETPQAAFNRAISKLNSKNLFDLWTTSCLFSCIDYFGNQNNELNFLMPTINLEQVTLFQKAVLASRAENYKRDFFTSHDSDMSYVFNALNDASYRIGLLDGNEDADVRLRRLFATIANSQVRFQERHVLDRLGRTYTMFHIIPLSSRNKLQMLQGNNFLDLPTIIPSQIGITVKDFLSIGFALLELIREKFITNPVINNDLKQYVASSNSAFIGDRRRAVALGKIIDGSKDWLHQLTFTAHDLVVANSSIFTLDNVLAYLRLVARSTRHMRDMIKNMPVYSEGYIPDRLSPLERFPIVELSDDRYIIPNLRYFDMSLTETLHFILQDLYPNNQYNQLNGYIQEIYLQNLIKDRLPNLVVINETTYYKSKKKLDGPDLTIVDPVNKTLITLESKSKRMRVSSRVAPATEALIEDLQRALDAFEKLPAKVSDLYANLAEYKSHQTMLDSTKENIPIGLVIVGEGVYFMPELLNDYLKRNPAHPLNTYPFPYCLIHVEAFERAVEISESTQASLYDLLHEYAQVTKSSGIKDNSAESFEGRHAGKRNQFVKKFVGMLFDEIKASFGEG